MEIDTPYIDLPDSDSESYDELFADIHEEKLKYSNDSVDTCDTDTTESFDVTSIDYGFDDLAYRAYLIYKQMSAIANVPEKYYGTNPQYISDMMYVVAHQMAIIDDTLAPRGYINGMLIDITKYDIIVDLGTFMFKHGICNALFVQKQGSYRLCIQNGDRSFTMSFRHLCKKHINAFNIKNGLLFTSISCGCKCAGTKFEFDETSSNSYDGLLQNAMIRYNFDGFLLTETRMT